MEGSLKRDNKLSLLAIMAANLVLFYLTIQTDTVFSRDWMMVATKLIEALPAGFGLVLIGILNAQLSSTAKARIVFLRWVNPLPGSEAFTRHAATDPRVDLAAIACTHGPLPTEPPAQNALWYKLYKSVEADPSVTYVHREFLFARDYSCIAFLMVIVLGTAGFFTIPSMGTAATYFGMLMLQFLLSMRAARNHGRRFVTTVLALKGAGR